MLDVRYHRSPNKAPDDGTKTMLGRKQLQWLKEELLASKATVKFIASGSEWQTNGHDDSWTSFDRERKEIFDFIDGNKIEGVVLLSGDRHFSAGYQVRDRLIEVTSGPLGSKNYPSHNLPEMIFNQSEGKMYCVFEVDTSGEKGPQPRLAVEVFRAGEGLAHRQAFTWDQVNGKAEIPRLPPSPAAE
jgi:alkaline phosphatase D